MAKALSVDLRRRVVEAVAAGASCRAAAARFEVGISSAIRWVARARTRGDLPPDKRGGNVRSHRIDEHRDLILGWIEEKPDLTLAEVAERLDETVGYRPLPSIVCRFFQRHGVTRKKDGARCRTGSSGYNRQPPSLVRRPAGPGFGAVGVHRRMRHLHQDGADVAVCREENAAALRFPMSTGRRRPSSALSGCWVSPPR